MEYSKPVTEFVKASAEGARQQTAAHLAWGFIREDEWHMDQDTGVISFEFSDGRIATASAQIIGTHDPSDGTFLWGWDHPSVDESLGQHAKLVYEFGIEHNVPQFTERKVICTEQEAWEFTTVASRLGNANGVYRADAGGPWVYFTFGEVRIGKHGP